MKKILLLLFVFLSGQLSAQWTQQTSGTSNILYTAYFLNTNTGFAAGAKGTILKTITGGANWFSVNSDTSFTCNEMVFLNSTTGIIVGSLGTILRTTNEGINWIKQTPITTKYLFGVNYNGSFVMVSGESGTILRSSTAGINWEVLPSLLPNHLMDVSIPDINKIYVSGWGALMTSTNQGTNWNILHSCISKNCLFYYKMQFFNILTGYFAGYYSGPGPYVFRKTINGGNNFANIGGLQSATDFHFTDMNNGIRIIDNVISRTTNGGLNWAYYSASIGSNFNDVYMSDLNYATVVGAGGRIMRTSTGGLTFINPINVNVPDRNSLLQNYPNPFNPATTLEFSIIKTGFVTLKIFDLNGREVESLVNENLNSGYYNIQWNAENYPSGIYFYKLETENFSETKRMILVK